MMRLMRLIEHWGFDDLPRVYLTLAMPVLVALCFVTQPLHSVDEPAHFLRTAQIANGDVIPALGPDRRSTGSYQPRGVLDVANFYGRSFGAYMHPERKSSSAEIGRLLAIKAGDDQVYAEHSNTTIYFPLAYAAPAAAFVTAKAFTDRPVVWMYAGRLINALIGLILTYLVLRYVTRGRLLFFVLALLPITLFQTAALSADSLLAPSAMAFAVVLRRIFEGHDFSWKEHGLAVLIMAFVGLGKIAYMPLVALPPIAAWLVRRKFDRTAVGLSLSAFLVFALWVAWSVTVHDLVFTVRQTNAGGEIDVQKQLALIAGHPSIFLRAFLGTMTPLNIGRYLASFSGGIIGWLDIKLPLPLMALNFIALAVTLLVDSHSRHGPAMIRPVVLLIVAVSAAAVFLLLYLQWNAVGAKDIVGVQGRYFLPLLPAAAIVTPVFILGARERLFTSVAAGWGAVSALLTIVLVATRYWSFG